MLSRSLRATVLIAVIASSLLLQACGALNRKREPRIAYQERPVEQLYAFGARRLDQRRWDDAKAYFEEVERQHPYSEWSRRAILINRHAN